MLELPLASAEFLAVDTETNGLPGDRCELTEVGAVLVGGGELHDSWGSLVGVETPLSRGIQRFTGISQAMIEAAPPASAVLPELAARLEGRVLVAHSASFDRRVLEQAFDRAGLEWPDPPVLCTVQLARRFAPLQRKRGLASLAAALGVEVGAVHRALPDAQTCARVFCALFGRLCANALTIGDAVALLRGRSRQKRWRGADFVGGRWRGDAPEGGFAGGDAGGFGDGGGGGGFAGGDAGGRFTGGDAAGGFGGGGAGGGFAGGASVGGFRGGAGGSRVGGFGNGDADGGVLRDSPGGDAGGGFAGGGAGGFQGGDAGGGVAGGGVRGFQGGDAGGGVAGGRVRGFQGGGPGGGFAGGDPGGPSVGDVGDADAGGHPAAGFPGGGGSQDRGLAGGGSRGDLVDGAGYVRDGSRGGRRRGRARRGARPHLSALPHDPGVYIFRDADGRPLYVGKSIDLRTRAAAHFSAGASWTAEAEHVDHQATESELGALLLEDRLIKTLRPPGNVRGKAEPDGFVYLRCRLDIPFPILEVAREPAAGHALCVGPLRGRAAAVELVEQLNSLFGLRHCGRTLPRRSHPSAYGQMGRCLSPCLHDLDPNVYRERLDAALGLFTSGGDGGTALLAHVDGQVREASAERRYERAAWLQRRRNRLDALLERLGGVLRAIHASTRLVLAPHPSESGRFDAVWIAGGRVVDWTPAAPLIGVPELTSRSHRAVTVAGGGWLAAEAIPEARLVGAWIAAHDPPALDLGLGVGESDHAAFLERLGVPDIAPSAGAA